MAVKSGQGGAGAGSGAGVASWPMRTATLCHCQRSEDGATWYSSEIVVANEVVEPNYKSRRF